jgi:hypothetical protein
MNGVEILSSETIYNTILPEWCIGVGLGCGFIFVMLMIISIVNERGIGVILSIIAIIASIVVAGLGDGINTNSVHHIEYKVTIDDSVSMNEFLDKYEILDQEGKIYTVRERE